MVVEVLDCIRIFCTSRQGEGSPALIRRSLQLVSIGKASLLFFAPKGVPIPTAVSVFPDEIYAAPRSWTEKAYPKLIHYNRLSKGGHFAAWEQPELSSGEIRAAFRSLR